MITEELSISEAAGFTYALITKKAIMVTKL